MADSQIAYRKIRGRIVPIRIKRDDQLKAGLKTAGAGVVAGAATAELASRATKKAAAYRVAAQRMFRASNAVLQSAARNKQMLFDFAGNAAQAKDAKTAAILMRHRAKLLRRARVPILGVGTTIAGYLLGKGAENIQESQTGRQLGIAGEGLAQVVGAGAATGILSLYYKRLGLRSFRKAFRYAKATAVGAKDTLPRIPIKTKHGTLKF